MALKRKISNSSLKALTVADGRLNDTEIPGFHARISPKGAIAFYLYYRLNGKQVNYRLGAAAELTAAQARDLAREKLAEVSKGNDVQQERLSARAEHERRKHLNLATYLEARYLPFLTARNPKTAERTYKHIRNRFPMLLSKDLDQITPWEVEKWRNEQRKLGKAAQTINYSVNSLKGALSRAVDWGLIASNPLSKVKPIKADNTRVRYLSAPEEKRLRTALRERDAELKNKRDSGNAFREARHQPLYPSLQGRRFADYLEPLILLAMNTGMRRGELLSLPWSAVSLGGSYLTVQGDKAKSKAGRTIPLNQEAVTALHDWREHNPDYHFVFEAETGKPLTDVKKPWANLLERAQISGFNFHDLRHHFASKLVMAGVDLNTVRELLGHADLKMTLRYAHLAPEHKAAAVNLIG
ncbi:site-specific integrase [Ferrimonas gelatinilytica]|uniref:Site-specific integrase n=1 Tax=Ferrimonas gelatinilytica TaxID=1255257 RepID=A0ABP9S0Q5_9GAMM